MPRPKLKDRSMLLSVYVPVKMHHAMRDALSELVRQRKSTLGKLIREAIAAHYKIPLK